MSELSIVNICPIEHADKINELAERLNKGPKNLSRLLEGTNGDQYLACHSWAWTEQDFLDFQNPEKVSELGVDLSEYAEALSHLIWSVVDMRIVTDYDPVRDNWQPTLEVYGLHVVEAAD